MTTLRKITTMVKDRLNGGDSTIDSSLDERDIIQFARGKMNEVLKLQFYENMQMGDRMNIPMYIATYTDIAIANDTIEAVKYAVLPERFVTLPYTKGIHSVHPQQEPKVDFIRANNHYVSKGLDVAYMEKNPSYYVEGFRIKFRERNFKTSWTKVIVKLLIAAPDIIGIDDDLPLLPDQETAVIIAATEYFSHRVPIDTLNDGNPDIGVTKPAQ